MPSCVSVTKEKNLNTRTERLPEPAERLGVRIADAGRVVMPPNIPNPLCQWHDGLCCFRQDRTDRCPWCHRTWTSILRFPHGCEARSAWSNGRDPHNKARVDWHVEMVALMRAEATQEAGQGVPVPHVSKGTLNRANAGCPVLSVVSRELEDVAA